MRYIITFFLSLIVSLVLTPIVRKAMLKLGILDMPSESRWHRQPVALMGGIAIFISFALVALLRVELKREILVILLGIHDCTSLVFGCYQPLSFPEK